MCKMLEDAMSWVQVSDRLRYVWFFVCVCMWYTYLTHTGRVAVNYVQNQCGYWCRRMFIAVFCLWERTPYPFGNVFTWHLACKLLTTVHRVVTSTNWNGRVGSFIKQKVWLQFLKSVIFYHVIDLAWFWKLCS
jgi:hypothetical protein